MTNRVLIVGNMMRKWGWSFKGVNQHKIRFKNPRWASAYTGTVVTMNNDGTIDLDRKRINNLKTDRVFFVDQLANRVMWCSVSELKRFVKNPHNTQIDSKRLPMFIRQQY